MLCYKNVLYHQVKSTYPLFTRESFVDYVCKVTTETVGPIDGTR